MIVFVSVLFGWVASLCLHEYAHARVAYAGGDHSVKEKGYLSLNPIRYTDPVFSIALPLLFLVLGGIGLPGGAVYIETWRLRSKQWRSAVSAAGPAANFIIALGLALALKVAPVEDRQLLATLSFLAVLQITAVVFNLLPIPPLDGFGIIAPFMSNELQERARGLAQWTLIGLFLILWHVESVGRAFWSLIYTVARVLGIPTDLAYEGFQLFRFWVSS
jgi:Zn-dependent protease